MLTPKMLVKKVNEQVFTVLKSKVKYENVSGTNYYICNNLETKGDKYILHCLEIIDLHYTDKTSQLIVDFDEILTLKECDLKDYSIINKIPKKLDTCVIKKLQNKVADATEKRYRYWLVQVIFKQGNKR